MTIKHRKGYKIAGQKVIVPWFDTILLEPVWSSVIKLSLLYLIPRKANINPEVK
jgi:hypothetical protein